MYASHAYKHEVMGIMVVGAQDFRPHFGTCIFATGELR